MNAQAKSVQEVNDSFIKYGRRKDDNTPEKEITAQLAVEYTHNIRTFNDFLTHKKG